MSAWAVPMAKRAPAAMAAESRSLFPFMIPPATLGFVVDCHANSVAEGYPGPPELLSWIVAGLLSRIVAGPLDRLPCTGLEGGQALGQRGFLDIPGYENQPRGIGLVRPGRPLDRRVEHLLAPVDRRGAVPRR